MNISCHLLVELTLKQVNLNLLRPKPLPIDLSEVLLKVLSTSLSFILSNYIPIIHLVDLALIKHGSPRIRHLLMLFELLNVLDFPLYLDYEPQSVIVIEILDVQVEILFQLRKLKLQLPVLFFEIPDL